MVNRKKARVIWGSNPSSTHKSIQSLLVDYFEIVKILFIPKTVFWTNVGKIILIYFLKILPLI